MKERAHLTLTQLQLKIKSSLADAMPMSYWVAAEISEMKVNYSGHCYLELVEKGGSNHIPKAKVAAVIWKSIYGVLASYFSSTAGCDLAQGLKILARVSVNYHELYGMSLVIHEIDPLYTIGDMELQRQETIRRLTEEGVMDMNKQIPLAPVLHRLAVISSRNAAGFRDFAEELRASGYGFRITLFDSFMQGHETEQSVISALDMICDRTEEFDAVVVIRGGGSQSDLAAFDSFRLCCHLAQFPLPVITGIGHDKDHSVADLVAAVSLKTPTAVARYLIDHSYRFEQRLDTLRQQLLSIAYSVVAEEKIRLDSMVSKLHRCAVHNINNANLTLNRLASAITRTSSVNIANARHRLDSYQPRLRTALTYKLLSENKRLDTLSDMLALHDPERILARGYSIVRANGLSVGSASALKTGDVIGIEFADGRAEATVTATETNNR